MNSNQLISNEEALRLFFNEDVYLVGDISPVENTDNQQIASIASTEKIVEVKSVATADNLQEPVAAITKVEETPAAYQQSFDFKYLGKNEKGILILVNDEKNPVSTPQGTELLRKLVLSINLKNADFALLNYAAYQTAKFEHLLSFFSCNMILSFGVDPTTLGLSAFELHQLNLHNDIRMIFTHNLHDLETDLAAKKTLWGTLKSLG